MEADAYLGRILVRESVQTIGPLAPASAVLTELRPTISAWADRWLVGIHPSGSYAKGTAIKSGTDVDVFVSLHPDTPPTLKEIYDNLQVYLRSAGYSPTPQNVSLNIRVGTNKVDVVPAKRQNLVNADHSLYRRRTGSWTKTNVATHINYVRNGNRLRETRILKLWRNQKKLDFPSFYLELSVINALGNLPSQNLSANVVRVLAYLRDKFDSARVVDPANYANVISDDLTSSEKAVIKNAATRALSASWGDFVT